MGYGLGTNLIKHCILELNKLYENNPEISELINNVVLIGGATKISDKNPKHKNIFCNVGGKIINIFSKFDSSLKMIYDENCIGLNPLELNFNKDDNLQIHNIDLTYLKINHKDYKNELGKVLQKINLI
jgi:hypothetical protein